MEDVTESHFICKCGFGADQRKTDASIIDHVRSCHGIDIHYSKPQPFYECHFDNTRLLNMNDVQEHLSSFHGVRLEKRYFDEHHHEVPPPETRLDTEAPCEPTSVEQHKKDIDSAALNYAQKL